MKKVTSIIFMALCLIASIANAGSVNLKYKWQVGKTYRFSVVENDNVSLGGGMMGMATPPMKFNTTSTFSLKIKSVATNGTASAVLYVEQFKVTSGNGAVLATLKDIPAEALVSQVEIDNKGNFTFKKIVYLLTTENSNILVSADVKDGQVSASAQAGDTKLNVCAEFDPKTGSLKAGYSVEKVKNPQPKQIEVKEDAQKIDIIPVAFLDLLKLPEEAIVENSEITAKMMEYGFTTKVGSIANNLASMNLKITTDRSSGNTTTDMMQSGMEGDAGSMNMSGIDMGGMNMGGSENPNQNSIPQMDLNGDINFDFDIATGIFKTLNGTISTVTRMMGVEMKVESTVKMNLVP